MPEHRTLGQRLVLKIGRALALRHRFVTVPLSCAIHPDARINPRNGRIRFGENCSIASGAVVQGNVELGDNCSVQMYSILVGYGTREDPKGQIQIGNNVRIASHVMLIAGNHVFSDIHRPICSQGLKCDPIVIEDDVWIAGRVSIMAGVTIGRGSVIGAGSLVTRSIPPMSVAMGSPARVVKRRGN